MSSSQETNNTSPPQATQQINQPESQDHQHQQPLGLPPPQTTDSSQNHTNHAASSDNHDANPPAPSTQTFALDHLGPMVVNSDGTLSRIASWAEMSDIERDRTLRVLAKRNKIRLAALEAQEAGQEEQGGGGGGGGGEGER